MTDTSLIPYESNDLALAGEIADHYAQSDTFAQACATWTQNTQRRYLNDLELFSAYLESAGIERKAQVLFSDAEAWRGMTFGLLKGFKLYLEQKGYAIGTIKGAISTIRVFCRLAGPAPAGAGVLDEMQLLALCAVKPTSGRKARNLDEDRKRRGIPTRRGHKKAVHTQLQTSQALALKKTSMPRSRRTRYSLEESAFLSKRDALMIGLLVEHALRCSEVALLTVESIDLRRGTITIYRPKTDRTDIQRMHRHTHMAAVAYLDAIGRTSGPLLSDFNTPGTPLSLRAINKRVGVLGLHLGVEKLSPHDLRHHWANDALLNQTPLNVVQMDGGWDTEYMPLRYARQAGTIGGNARISED